MRPLERPDTEEAKAEEARKEEGETHGEMRCSHRGRDERQLWVQGWEEARDRDAQHEPQSR